MNLVIDVGNTFVKLAVFNGDDVLVYKDVVNYADVIVSTRAVNNAYTSINRAIISSVSNFSESDLQELKSMFKLLVLDNTVKIPFNNKYETPNTLGVDRIALVCAAHYLYPKRDVLVIDAGTCITYDFLTYTNNYLGGAISPGLRMRYKSLNSFTANLPLLETSMPNNIIGTSTNKAINSGVVYGVLSEIDGVIARYKLNYSHLTVILTGGDCNFLSKQLKSSIFVNSNFLLEGLNFILKYNSNE